MEMCKNAFPNRFDDSLNIVWTLFPDFDKFREGVPEGALCDEREDAERLGRNVCLALLNDDFVQTAKIRME